MYGSKGLVKETFSSVCISNRPLTNRLSAKNFFLCYCHCIEEMICPFFDDDDVNRQTFLLFSWRRSDCDWKRFCNYNEKLLDWEIAKRRKEKGEKESNLFFHRIERSIDRHHTVSQSVSQTDMYVCKETIWLIRCRITNMDGIMEVNQSHQSDSISNNINTKFIMKVVNECQN